MLSLGSIKDNQSLVAIKDNQSLVVDGVSLPTLAKTHVCKQFREVGNKQGNAIHVFRVSSILPVTVLDLGQLDRMG
jgi:hypothetical protein